MMSGLLTMTHDTYMTRNMEEKPLTRVCIKNFTKKRVIQVSCVIHTSKELLISGGEGDPPCV